MSIAGVLGGTLTATVEDSTFSGNTTPNSDVAGRGGGAISVSAFVNTSTATLTVVNSTFSGNDAGTGRGGGILAGAGANSDQVTVNLYSVSFDNNAGDLSGTLEATSGSTGTATFNVENTILAGSDGTTCVTSGAGTSTINGGGYNLVEGSDCTFAGDTTGNITGMDPLLGTLADNGGPTMTLLPANNSPVANMGDPACAGPDGALSADQRGDTRPVGGACEMGSVELQ
jgi:hypothetical protein